MKENTQPINVDPNQPEPPPREKRSARRVILYVLLGLVILLGVFYLAWVRPAMTQPLSDSLVIPTLDIQSEIDAILEKDATAQAEFLSTVPHPTNLPGLPIMRDQTPTSLPGVTSETVKPVCGNEDHWDFLLIGIDYRGDGFLYGLADVMRVGRVDFVDMKVNMVALPRDMVVEAPAGTFTEENPMKLNQAYLFGTEGWGGYSGGGNGANSLAEVIRYNFGVTPDHYAVVNFRTVVAFIDAIGGVEVDLPQSVYDPSPELGSFPAGVQTLNGERALALMRIRTNYSDAFRVGNQNLVIKGLIRKLMQPATLLRVPSLVNEFREGFLTDLNLEQLTSIGVCFLRNFDTADLNSQQIPTDLLTSGRVFLPSLNGESFVYKWDQRVVDWIHATLLAE